jgi:hypothetical protein
MPASGQPLSVFVMTLDAASQPDACLASASAASGA